jgi:hypothetical protein
MTDHRNGSAATVSGWYWLLLIPFIATLWVPFYNSIEPTFQGIPFFYWYQLLWVFLSSGITAFVYFMTERNERRH